MAQSVLSFISSPPSLFSFLPLHFHLTLVLSSFSLFPLLSFCVCRFSVPPSSPLLYPSLSYRGLRRELAASVFVGNFVLAGLLLSMAHLFAPVKKKKKITKKLFQPMSSVVSLGILVWIFAVRFFFFSLWSTKEIIALSLTNRTWLLSPHTPEPLVQKLGRAKCMH